MPARRAQGAGAISATATAGDGSDLEALARAVPAGRMAAGEDLRAAAAADGDDSVLDEEQGALLDADDGVIPHEVVLADALLARLAPRRHGRVDLEEVGVDVEGDERERVEGSEADDVPVVGGQDGGAGDVGSGARADVGQARSSARPDGIQQTRLPEALEQR